MTRTRFRLSFMLGLLWAFHFLPSTTSADSLAYSTAAGKKTIRDVLVISQTDDRVEYLVVESGGYFKKKTLYVDENWAKDISVTFSQKEERRRLLETWKDRTSSAILTRSFGPSVTIAGFGVRYPLPENVTYIMGSPAIIEGAEFYIGKESSNASKVFFRDIQSVEVEENGAAVRILWRNSESSQGDFLTSWKYGDRQGAPPVFFAMDMDTLSFIELPFKNVRKIAITGQKTIRCSGNPVHSFVEPPSAWKFCPICGKPLQTTQ